MMKRQHFRLYELIVMIAVSVILLAVTLPAVNRAADSAVDVQCLANKKQAMEGITRYTADFDGIYFAQDGQKLWWGVLGSCGKRILNTNVYNDLNLRYITLASAVCPKVEAQSKVRDNWGWGYGIQRTNPNQLKERPSAEAVLGAFMIEIRKPDYYCGNTKAMKAPDKTPMLMDTWHVKMQKGFPFFTRRSGTAGPIMIHEEDTIGTMFADGHGALVDPEELADGFRPFGVLDTEGQVFELRY